MKHILSVCILAILGQFCFAGPISDLAGRAVAGYHPILAGVPLMEVVVISDCENENVALNPNVSFQEVDMSMTKKTAYVQELDGSRLKPRLLHQQANSLPLSHLESPVEQYFKLST